MFRIATLAVVILATATAAHAATPTYWTPAKMASMARQLPGPVYDAGAGSRPTFNKGATCVGIGVPRTGAYPGFRCAVVWKQGLTAGGTASMWVRPRGSSYCVSSTSFASCPAVVVKGDPRLCANPSSPSDRYADYCAVKAARLAVVAKIGGALPNLACVVRTALVHACAWEGGLAVVRFSLVGGRWRTSVG